jgi:hypothetical protein
MFGGMYETPPRRFKRELATAQSAMSVPINMIARNSMHKFYHTFDEKASGLYLRIPVLFHQA